MAYSNIPNSAGVAGQGKQSLHGRIMNSNLFTVLLVALFIVSVIRVTKEVTLRYEINKEIEELQSQMQQLNTKTEDMQDLIAYLKSDDYVEKQARLQLNLSKPGERQVNIKGIKVTSDVAAESTGSESNFSKWFNYFFE